MARSRKKHAITKDYSRGKSGTRLNKRFASKAVRKYKGTIPDGNGYKKIYCSWNIFDQRYFWQEESEGEIRHWGWGTTKEDVEKAKRK